MSISTINNINMGLFANIKCRVSLPVPKDQGELANEKWAHQEFQTNDLLPLSEYQIRANGTLWLRKDGKWSLEKHSGSINFYASYQKAQNDYWVEFMAFFENGKLLKNVSLVNWEQESNTERKQEAEHVHSIISKRTQHRQCWYWRLLFTPWNRVIRWSCRLDRRFHRWCLRLIDKWERWASIGS